MIVFFVRILQGYADTLNATCVYSILATTFDDINKCVVMTESMVAIGNVVNCIMTSVVFNYFGFRVNFMYCSVVCTIIGLINAKLLPNDLNEDEKLIDNDQEE